MMGMKLSLTRGSLECRVSCKQGLAYILPKSVNTQSLDKRNIRYHMIPDGERNMPRLAP